MINNHKIIALCTSRVNDSNVYKIVVELNKLLSSLDARLFIYNINSDLYWDEDNISAETAVFDLIDYSITDAVIIMDEKIKSRTITEKIISRSRRHGIPVIVIDGKYEDCATVSMDYENGFEKVVRHTIEDHGIKDVHFIAGIKGNPFSDARNDIFKKVIAENGIEFSESMISYGQFWAGPTVTAVEKLIAENRLPRAIICANDIMAIAVSDVLKAYEILIPDQVIVTGFDGIDEIYFTEPRITSIRFNSSNLAAAVFSLLEKCLEDPDCREEQMVASTLVCGGSCGCRDNFDTEYGYHLKSLNSYCYRYQDVIRVLFDIMGKMQSQNNLVQAARCMNHGIIYNLCCMINKSCVNDFVNYFQIEQKAPYDDIMYAFFDTDSPDKAPYSVLRRDIVPNLAERLEIGYPLIFNTLDYIGHPFGYICFDFRSYDMTNYGKIPQTVTSISAGIGGYINMRYQKYLTARVEKMYKYDSLTGLYNRVSFNREFKNMRTRIKETNIRITAVLTDLDGLKIINDTYGHTAGDNAIRQAAYIMKNACPENALCVRMGGDEMLALIEGDCDADMLIASIRSGAEDYNNFSDLEYDISMSIGSYSTENSDEAELDFLVKKADDAMYSEKREKRAAGIGR